MAITHVALWILIVLAVAVAGVLTVLDEILSDTPYTEPEPSEPAPYGELESKNTERRARGECRT
jgi:hypothetical protein